MTFQRLRHIAVATVFCTALVLFTLGGLRPTVRSDTHASEMPSHPPVAPFSSTAPANRTAATDDQSYDVLVHIVSSLDRSDKP